MTNFYDLPVYIRKALNSASGFGRTYINNEKVNEALLNKFGLVTDNNEHVIDGFGKIDFDWRVEKWYIL